MSRLNMRQQRTREAKTVRRVRARSGVYYGVRVIIVGQHIRATIRNIAVRDLHVIKPDRSIRMRHVGTDLHGDQSGRRRQIYLVLHPGVLNNLVLACSPLSRAR